MLVMVPSSLLASQTRCAGNNSPLPCIYPLLTPSFVPSTQTPVQKWQTSDIQSSRIEKNKHVHIDIAGPNPISLHFHAGSKDLAEEILKKLESSKALASAPSPSSPEAGPSVSRPAGAEIERPKSAAPKAVHFDTAAPVIIPDEVEGEEEPEPTLHSDYEYHEPEPVPVPEPEHEPEPEPASNVARVIHDDGEPAVALYDFTADGDDEITIHEGEPLLVVDKDSDEWWKVRNEHGEEGVVPAQYVEARSSPYISYSFPNLYFFQLASGETASSAAVIEEPEVDLELSASQAAEEVAAREEAEREQRAERERLEKERKRKQEAEVRARAAAASAEAERKRREKERERQKEKERVAAEAAEKEERKLANRDSISSDTSASGNRRPAAGSSRSGRHADQREFLLLIRTVALYSPTLWNQVALLPVNFEPGMIGLANSKSTLFSWDLRTVY